MITKAHQIALTKYLLLVVILFTACNTNDSKVINDVQVNEQDIVLNQLEGKWYYKDVAFNGYAIAYHLNGNIAQSVGYYDGKKEGIVKKWFDTGALQKESNYNANQLEGIVQSWWPDGTLSSESHYVNGVRQGVQKRWHPNGQLALSVTMNNGKEEGMQQAWLENGKIYVNYEAKNGRTFGLRKAKLCYELEDETVKY